MPVKTTANTLLLAASAAREIVLASSSIYRQELLARLGLRFTAVAPNLIETALAGEAPSATALRLAEAKARSVSSRCPDALIVGSDQVADCDGAVVGKPQSHADAVAQLTLLSG